MNLQDIIDAFSTVNFTSSSFIYAASSIIFNPLFWNIVARNEYKRKTLTKLVGTPRDGCYYLAGIIFMLGILRDLLFYYVVSEDVTCPFLDNLGVKLLGYACIGIGGVLVYCSMYKLGICGTYLGDYFGIYMDEKITSFPFNVCDNPMYNGSTLNFLGTALTNKSFSGIVLSALVYVVYQIALLYEGPFTQMIYANKEKEEKEKRDKKVEDKKDKAIEDKKDKKVEAKDKKKSKKIN
ncbi:phospholipid methyltransferase [Anaeromyces robustus]|jgi:methylene-fatty-acyl-phospholipid synthase|uniref:Phosphatidyl-N-methylethanolamine N-methyltransferase n=1 Tax=Anaeromyces robustus TaxID=1754192 RepID=A0A1Y1X5F1_9FUNG|nr:phospholipid methyltransferase [Anaeromyces robustus]|eukprot:ORX80932.1 phospholipid methyltransferase [Anaeromyces robustus]